MIGFARNENDSVSALGALPLSERICQLTCLGTALWTLCCWSVVAAGGTLRSLLVMFALTSFATLLGVVASKRQATLMASPEVTETKTTTNVVGLSRNQLAVGGFVALLATTVVWRSTSVVLTWWLVVSVLLLAAPVVLAKEAPCPPSEPAEGRRRQAWLWGVAGVCVVLALVSHRPDADDAFYVGLAVRAVDDPNWALLGSDPLHGIEGLPLHMPLYRLHSYELANAALAKVTGLPAIYYFHWLAAAIGAMLLPLAHALLFRRLTPRHWLEATVVLVFLLLAIGETPRWVGNFALVRMWQGKGLYLFVFLPLIYAFALDLGRRPGRRGVLLLGAAQIAAIGCSSSAIWGGPLAAALGLVTTFRPSRRFLIAMAVAAVPCAGVLAIGLRFKRDLADSSSNLARASTEPGERLAEALTLGLGDGRLFGVAIAVIMLAWTLSPPGVARRFAVVVPLGGLLLLNPHTEILTTAHITGGALWRALWMVPIPILMSLVLVSPLRIPLPRRWRWATRLGVVMVSAAFALTVPRYSALSTENEGLRLTLPGLKVPRTEYGLAAEINHLAGAGSLILAPESVNTWIPTFHNHADPLIVRDYFGSPAAEFIGKIEIRRRREMVAFVAGKKRHAGAARRFREGLLQYPLRVVCFSKAGRPNQVRRALRQVGFRPRLTRADYEIWLRPEQDPTQDDDL